MRLDDHGYPRSARRIECEYSASDDRCDGVWIEGLERAAFDCGYRNLPLAAEALRNSAWNCYACHHADRYEIKVCYSKHTMHGYRPLWLAVCNGLLSGRLARERGPLSVPPNEAPPFLDNALDLLMEASSVVHRRTGASAIGDAPKAGPSKATGEREWGAERDTVEALSKKETSDAEEGGVQGVSSLCLARSDAMDVLEEGLCIAIESRAPYGAKMPSEIYKILSIAQRLRERGRTTIACRLACDLVDNVVRLLGTGPLRAGTPFCILYLRSAMGWPDETESRLMTSRLVESLERWFDGLLLDKLAPPPPVVPPPSGDSAPRDARKGWRSEFDSMAAEAVARTEDNARRAVWPGDGERGCPLPRPCIEGVEGFLKGLRWDEFRTEALRARLVPLCHRD